MRALFAIAFAFVTASSVAADTQRSIVGVWYEEANYGGSRVISVWNLKADGSYESVYRRCLPQGGEADSASSGRWTYVNGRIRTVSPTAQLTYVVNEYETQSNDGRIWVYRAISGDGYSTYGPVTFRDTRVQPGAKLPTCDTTS